MKTILDAHKRFRNHRWPPSRLYFLAFGFLPILCISLAVQEILPLSTTGPAVVYPFCFLSMLIGTFCSRIGHQASVGLVSGLIAVAMYDAFRLTFVYLGTWDDFIPGIGDMLLNSRDTHWLVGYTWRFLLNGGCLGIAYTMLGGRGWKSGALFGLFVCSGLFATLAVSKAAREHLFHLSPSAALMVLIGHLIYGIVLGRCVSLHHQLSLRSVRIRFRKPDGTHSSARRQGWKHYGIPYGG